MSFSRTISSHSTSPATPMTTGGTTRRRARPRSSARGGAGVADRSTSWAPSAPVAARSDSTDLLATLSDSRVGRFGQTGRDLSAVVVVDGRSPKRLVAERRRLDGDLAGGASRAGGHHGDPRREIDRLV